MALSHLFFSWDDLIKGYLVLWGGPVPERLMTKGLWAYPVSHSRTFSSILTISAHSFTGQDIMKKEQNQNYYLLNIFLLISLPYTLKDIFK